MAGLKRVLGGIWEASWANGAWQAWVLAPARGFGGIDQGNSGDPYERPIRDFTRVLMRITKSVHIFTLPLSQYP